METATFIGPKRSVRELMARALQIHITPGEMIDILEAVFRSNAFDFAVLRFQPFSIEMAMSPAEMREILAVCPDGFPGAEICLSAAKIDVSATSQLEFVDRNADRIDISICYPKDGALRESLISGTATSPANKALLDDLKRQLRKLTKAGGTCIGSTGLRHDDKSHLHSLGARNLSENGIKLVQLAGEVQFLPHP